ncbi:MAG: polymer-forming cytoskeletal protein [Defluviitaleaceae bacterium]|nr:polymer-forming cytoskeletal protein [Defluviitaleaceae bacterium]
MAKEKKDYVKPANTFLDKGVTIRAQKLSGSETVRIDGTFIGDIDLDGHLQVGESGYIQGNMQVSYALIAGEVFGNILCRATVHLSSSARVHGDITTGRVIMDEGSVFHGSCKTRDDEPEIVVI